MGIRVFKGIYTLTQKYASIGGEFIIGNALYYYLGFESSASNAEFTSTLLNSNLYSRIYDQDITILALTVNIIQAGAGNSEYRVLIDQVEISASEIDAPLSTTGVFESDFSQIMLENENILYSAQRVTGSGSTYFQIGAVIEY